MSEGDFAALYGLLRAPIRDLSSGADIRPVQAGLFSPDGEPLLMSFVGALPSTLGALAAVRGFFGDRWHPGDVAITNDMDAGAINACEIITVAPIYAAGALAGWSVVRGRVPDFGGWEPGGFSPQAVDRWAEGARLEPVKVMARGVYRREVTDLLRLNSRTPATTLSTVRHLAAAAQDLGQAYAERSETVGAHLPALRDTESDKVSAAFRTLPGAFCRQREEIVAPWLNKHFGDIEVAAARSGDELQVRLSGPSVAPCPINLGRFAAQDVVVAATAAACGLQDMATDALPARISVSLEEPSLVSAPLPTPVGLGRQVSGQALYRALAVLLGLTRAGAELQWRQYCETVCGTGFDAATGKLASANAVRIRKTQSEEVAA